MWGVDPEASEVAKKIESAEKPSSAGEKRPRGVEPEQMALPSGKSLYRFEPVVEPGVLGVRRLLLLAADPGAMASALFGLSSSR